MLVSFVMLISIFLRLQTSQAERYEDSTSWLQFEKASLAQTQAPASCGAIDLGCQAQQAACNLASSMMTDWPVSSYPQLKAIHTQLQQVCQGALAEVPPSGDDAKNSEPSDTSLDLSQRASGASGAGAGESKHQAPSFTCPAPQQCALDVVNYIEKQNPGIKYALQADKSVAKTAVDTLKELLKSVGVIALKGSIVFGLLGNVLNNFFPGAQGLPSNPCTYATSTDWGKCVWQQVMPFVQSFVAQQFDQAFSSLWQATILGYQSELWTLNATAYQNSAHYPNGTVSFMSNSTRDRMYSDLAIVHSSMIGAINLFMTGYAINTTAGAYLAHFASLHVGVMNNLFGSLTYRTAGDKYVFQMVIACYAQSVYQAATQAFKARMATFQRQIQTSSAACGGFTPALCSLWSGTYADTWPNCPWSFSASAVTCVFGNCLIPSDTTTQPAAETCFNQHKAWVEAQTVAMWQTWLGLIPLWLNNVIVMQNVSVRNTTAASTPVFNCQAF